MVYTAKFDQNGLDHLADIAYLFNIKVTYAPDAFGRPTKASSYVTSTSYFPNGALKHIEYGSGQRTNYTLNERLLVVSVASPVVDLTFTYDATNNVKTITNRKDKIFNRSMEYDEIAV